MELTIIAGIAILVVGLVLAALFKSGKVESKLDEELQKKIDDPDTPELEKEVLIRLRDLRLTQAAQSVEALKKKIKGDVTEYLATTIPQLEARVAALEAKLKQHQQ